jgi:hypothetical protein
MTFPILQFLAGESSGQTGTIQDKIAIWRDHQPVKNEPVIDFPTPQEDMSCKDLEGHVEALYGDGGFRHVKKCSSPQISKGEPTKVEFGVVESLRMTNTKTCHLVGQGSSNDIQGE